MWKTGLTSISFRKLSCEEIIALTARAGLTGIEWGGDGHVLPGNPERAAEVARATREAGLEVLSLGSYYHPGADPDSVGDQVLELCQAMGTDTVRVWAGNKGSLAAEGDIRRAVIASLKTFCAKAAALGITVCTEYHANTLTDNAASALRMLSEVGADNLRTYWQPVVYDTADVNVRALAAVLPKTENIHVFSWTLDENNALVRHPLEDCADAWKKYIDLLRNDSRDRAFMIEFVCNDEPDAFLHDAEILKSWVG